MQTFMEILGPIAALFGPLALVCTVIYLVGGWALRPGLSKIARYSAISWFIILGLVYAFVILTVEICTGNIVYGYVDCGRLPVAFADTSLALVVMTTILAIAYCGVMTLICGILEWRYRHR